jgi:hypothetical protein
MQKEIDINVLYIASASYSGSTLLSFVLNAHPQIVTIGEMGPIRRAEQNPDYPCSCGVRLVECPFFKQIQAKMREKGFAFELDKMDLRFRYSNNRVVRKLMIGHLISGRITQLRSMARKYIPGFASWVENKCERNKAFMLSALELTSAQWFLDASKDWNTLDFLRKTKEIHLKVIHLRRDPRGFCNSQRKHKGSRVEKTAKLWVRYNRMIEGVLEKLSSGCVYPLNYEDFCRSPADSLGKITAFLGIPAISTPNDFRSIPHHIIGNRMRLPSDERTTISLDDKWRQELSEEEKDAVQRIAGKLAERYGYLT